jgi:hypothetical protein
MQPADHFSVALGPCFEARGSVWLRRIRAASPPLPGFGRAGDLDRPGKRPGIRPGEGYEFLFDWLVAGDLRLHRCRINASLQHTRSQGRCSRLTSTSRTSG